MKNVILVSCIAVVIGATGVLAEAQGISIDPGRGFTGEPVQLESTRLAACNLIDFEGLADLQPIGTVAGTPVVDFGPSWLALIDSDAGGSGIIANEPSPSTVSFFIDTLDPVNFSEAVQYVELYYSASAISVPVTLTAWDGPGGTGAVVATAVGNTVGSSLDGALCSGDPDGFYCLWDSVALTSATPNIMSITLGGAAADQFGLDNMVFCTEVPATGACCLPSGACSTTTEINCLSMGGTYLGDGTACLGDGNGDGTDDACVTPVPAFNKTITVLVGLLVLVSGAFLIRRMRM